MYGIFLRDAEKNLSFRLRLIEFIRLRLNTLLLAAGMKGKVNRTDLSRRSLDEVAFYGGWKGG